MEIAKIQVSGVKAVLLGKGPGRWEIPAGIIGAGIRFAYGPEWTGLSKTVVFDCGGVTKDVVNAGELVTIPAEVVARPERKLLVGIYGVDASGEKAIPTLWLEGYVCAAADPSGDASTEPALPVWAQLEARIRALEEKSRTCAVSWVLEHASCSNRIEEVGYNGSMEAVLTADTGYVLDSVTVTMGAVDITAWAYRDGKVSIGAVTGDVVITAAAVQDVAADYIPLTTVDTSGYALAETGVPTAATSNWAYTHFIPAAEGQRFRYTGDTSLYSVYPSVCGYDGSGKLAEVLVANGNHSQGKDFTIPAGVSCIRCCFYTSDAVPHSIAVLSADMDAAGEVDFTEGITVSATGIQTDKAGGGATDYIPVEAGGHVTVYNIVPQDGGRIVMYDSNRVFKSAVTIYTQGVIAPAVTFAEITDASVAYVRVSANVLRDVKATVRPGAAQ